MSNRIETVQGNRVSRSFSWSEAEPKVAIQGPTRGGLRAANHGSSVTLAGSLSSPGRHEITITQTRTVKVTIEVLPKKSILQTSVLNVLRGKNEPVDPTATP